MTGLLFALVADLHGAKELPSICADHLSRLYEEVARNQGFKKYVIYVLADFLRVSQGGHCTALHCTGSLARSVGPLVCRADQTHDRWMIDEVVQETKRILLPGINAMLGLCTDYEYQQLYGILDPAGKALFKAIYSDYQRDFKFKGKI